MKARVKETGEIVEVEPTFVDGNKVYSWVTNNGYFHSSGSLDFETITQEKNDVKEKSLPKDEPDYWDKLHHQAAIAAMSAFVIRGCNPEDVAQLSLELAGVMIEKLKNEK